jgi:predicted 2-oxoglutarate/Fe(II)-dependent dioxygenase YbiX
MLLQIPEVLSAEQVAGFRKVLETSTWVDESRLVTSPRAPKIICNYLKTTKTRDA